MKTKFSETLFQKQIDLNSCSKVLGEGTTQECEFKYYDEQGRHYASDLTTYDDNGNKLCEELRDIEL